MKANNHLKEGTGDRRRRVWVAEGDEVRVLGERVDNGEDDEFPVDLGEALDEVHRDVCPHLGRYHERLQETRRLQGGGLVALACDARAHKVSAQPLQCLLDPLMACSMGHHDDLLAQILDRRDEDTLAMEKEPMGGMSWRREGSFL